MEVHVIPTDIKAMHGGHKNRKATNNIHPPKVYNLKGGGVRLGPCLEGTPPALAFTKYRGWEHTASWRLR